MCEGGSNKEKAEEQRRGLSLRRRAFPRSHRNNRAASFSVSYSHRFFTLERSLLDSSVVVSVPLLINNTSNRSSDINTTVDWELGAFDTHRRGVSCPQEDGRMTCWASLPLSARSCCLAPTVQRNATTAIDPRDINITTARSCVIIVMCG